MRMARKNGIIIDTDVLPLFWVNLTYDMLAVRLSPKIDIVKSYQRFVDYRARKTRIRIAESIEKQMDNGLDNRIFLRLERLMQTGEGMYFRTRHMLSLPTVQFNMLMSKWAYAVMVLIKFMGQMVLVTGVFLAIATLMQYFTQGTVVGSLLFDQVVTNRLYQLIVLLLIFINGHSILIRMDDKEVS